MSFGDEIGNLLRQYESGTGPTQDTEQHFDQAARNLPPEQVSNGLSEAFRSSETPPFGQMVGHLFSQGDQQQQTGMVNQLLGGMGPAVLGALLGARGGGSGLGGIGGGTGGLGGGILASVLGNALNRSGGREASLTPEEVSQLSPDQVREIASHAERENPGIIDQMSRFYAEHPSLVKTLGGAALSIALGRMANRR